MPTRLIPSHSTVVAYLALFIALGGTAFAVTALPPNSVGKKQIRKAAVTGNKIKNGTVRNTDIRRNTILGRNMRAGTLSGREIVESSLGAVPLALSAERLQGFAAADFKLRCPDGTALSSGECMELQPRPAMSWGQANGTCAVAGRRLALFGELTAFYSSQRPIASQGELSASVAESRSVAGRVDAVVLRSATGTTTSFVDANGSDAFPFRCVAPLTN